MKCPRKFYLVISRTAKESWTDSGAIELSLFDTMAEAIIERDKRNEPDNEDEKAHDWRIEKFVKGD